MRVEYAVCAAACAGACASLPLLGGRQADIVLGRIEAVDAADNVATPDGPLLLTARGLKTARECQPPDASMAGVLVALYPADACDLQSLRAVGTDGTAQPVSAVVSRMSGVVAFINADEGSCTLRTRAENVRSVLGDRAVAIVAQGGVPAVDIGAAQGDAAVAAKVLVVDRDTGAAIAERMRRAARRGLSARLKLDIPDAAVHPAEQKAPGDGGVLTPTLKVTLIAVLLVLMCAFTAAIYMQCHIRRLETELGEQRRTAAREAVAITDELLQRLEVVRYSKGAGLVAVTALPSDGVPSAPPSPVRTESGEDVCPICLDDLCAGPALNKLPCGHVFHAACVQHWLRTRSPCCPMCKYDVRDAFVGEACAQQAGAPEKRGRPWAPWAWLRARRQGRADPPAGRAPESPPSAPGSPPIVAQTPQHVPAECAAGGAAGASMDAVPLAQTTSDADLSSHLQP